MGPTRAFMRVLAAKERATMSNIGKTAEDLKIAHVEGKNAVELALLSREKLGAEFGVISFIASFRLAFDIPLPVLQHAQAWWQFGWGSKSISDDEFSALLTPWLPKR
ncbi:hypothetical protein AB0L74_33900 [Streptomyces sp. NPDC052020]|uniref:hypothetical protein n=1 Tax=Streptomyces sp. NPDC052020 TaxID=3155677 RepID=UPI003441B839